MRSRSTVLKCVKLSQTLNALTSRARATSRTSLDGFDDERRFFVGLLPSREGLMPLIAEAGIDVESYEPELFDGP